MKVKWDIKCECVMLVLSDTHDQYRVMNVGTVCDAHKADNTTRNIWKHHTIDAS